MGVAADDEIRVETQKREYSIIVKDRKMGPHLTCSPRKVTSRRRLFFSFQWLNGAIMKWCKMMKYFAVVVLSSPKYVSLAKVPGMFGLPYPSRHEPSTGRERKYLISSPPKDSIKCAESIDTTPREIRCFFDFWKSS